MSHLAQNWAEIAAPPPTPERVPPPSFLPNFNFRPIELSELLRSLSSNISNRFSFNCLLGDNLDAALNLEFRTNSYEAPKPYASSSISHDRQFKLGFGDQSKQTIKSFRPIEPKESHVEVLSTQKGEEARKNCKYFATSNFEKENCLDLSREYSRFQQVLVPSPTSLHSNSPFLQASFDHEKARVEQERRMLSIQPITFKPAINPFQMLTKFSEQSGPPLPKLETSQEVIKLFKVEYESASNQSSESCYSKGIGMTFQPREPESNEVSANSEQHIHPVSEFGRNCAYKNLDEDRFLKLQVAKLPLPQEKKNSSLTQTIDLTCQHSEVQTSVRRELILQRYVLHHNVNPNRRVVRLTEGHLTTLQVDPLKQCKFVPVVYQQQEPMLKTLKKDISASSLPRSDYWQGEEKGIEWYKKERAGLSVQIEALRNQLSCCKSQIQQLEKGRMMDLRHLAREIAQFKEAVLKSSFAELYRKGELALRPSIESRLDKNFAISSQLRPQLVQLKMLKALTGMMELELTRQRLRGERELQKKEGLERRLKYFEERLIESKA